MTNNKNPINSDYIRTPKHEFPEFRKQEVVFNFSIIPIHIAPSFTFHYAGQVAPSTQPLISLKIFPCPEITFFLPL